MSTDNLPHLTSPHLTPPHGTFVLMAAHSPRPHRCHSFFVNEQPHSNHWNGVECWLCWLLAAGCWLRAASCWLLSAGCWHCWLLAAGYWLLRLWKCLGSSGWGAEARGIRLLGLGEPLGARWAPTCGASPPAGYCYLGFEKRIKNLLGKPG